MADRVLRGSRLGAVSYETDRNHDLAPRQIARYRTENGEEFQVPFADDAEIPGTWLCKNGMEGTLIEGDLPEPKKVKPPRTHWDMLLERRSVEELEELLKERLDLIRSRRPGGVPRRGARGRWWVGGGGGGGPPPRPPPPRPRVSRGRGGGAHHTSPCVHPPVPPGAGGGGGGAPPPRTAG